MIVHPLLDHANAVKKISPWFDRLHAIVIGPGLGRDTETLSVVINLIKIIKDKKIPLVVDADGLFLITENITLLEDITSPVILTPNEIEFQRLSSKTNGIEKLIHLNNNIMVLKKGLADEFFCMDPKIQWKSELGGSGRRCGGQGDLLSGSIATFLNWNLQHISEAGMNIPANKSAVAMSLSCYAASRLIRLCNEKAFKTRGRSMLATDMIEYIHDAFEELFQQ